MIIRTKGALVCISLIWHSHSLFQTISYDFSFIFYLYIFRMAYILSRVHVSYQSSHHTEHYINIHVYKITNFLFDFRYSFLIGKYQIFGFFVLFRELLYRPILLVDFGLFIFSRLRI